MKHKKGMSKPQKDQVMQKVYKNASEELAVLVFGDDGKDFKYKPKKDCG